MNLCYLAFRNIVRLAAQKSIRAILIICLNFPVNYIARRQTKNGFYTDLQGRLTATSSIFLHVCQLFYHAINLRLLLFVRFLFY